jgi:hypothetical protein
MSTSRLSSQKERDLLNLRLRASNEGSPRPRVARAQETNQVTIYSSLQARSHLLREGGLVWSTTAHVERPQFHRGGSVSTVDQPGRPPSSSGISPLPSGISPHLSDRRSYLVVRRSHDAIYLTYCYLSPFHDLTLPL